MTEKKEYVQIKTTDNPEYAGPGWDLIRVTFRECIDWYDQLIYTNHGSYNKRVYSRPYKVPVFVMGETRDQFVLETKETFEKMSKKIHESENEKSKLKEKNIELLASEDSWRKTATNFQDKYFAEVKNKDEWANKARLMEQDIAKIRNAIGEIRMNEILGVK